MDLFLKEDIAYTQRLMDAAIPVEASVVPGAYHVFDMYVPHAALTVQFVE